MHISICQTELISTFQYETPCSSIQRKSRVYRITYKNLFHSLLVPIVLRFQNDNLLWEHLLIYHSFWYVAVAALKSHKYCRYKKFLFDLTRKKNTNFETMSIFVLSKAKITPTISSQINFEWPCLSRKSELWGKFKLLIHNTYLTPHHEYFETTNLRN